MAYFLRDGRGTLNGDTSQLALARASAVIAGLKKDLTVSFREGRALIYETPQDTEPFDHMRVEDEKGNEVSIPEQY